MSSTSDKFSSSIFKKKKKIQKNSFINEFSFLFLKNKIKESKDLDQQIQQWCKCQETQTKKTKQKTVKEPHQKKKKK